MHRDGTRFILSSLLFSLLFLPALSEAAANSDGVSRQAADLVALAQQYDQGNGAEQDFAKANEIYCRAARLGSAEAQFRLGWIYAAGRGVRRDTGVAAALFAMAAEQGHEHAKKRLKHFRLDPGMQLPSCLGSRAARPDMKDLPAVEAPATRDWHAVQKPVTKNRQAVEALVKRLAPQYEIDPQLVMAVIAAESDFDPTAVSPRQAQGLMQLIPETADRFGVKQVFDPADNIRGGLAYLRWLMAYFRGDVKLVLAAYNAGERAVERHKGVPPFDETRQYVQRITSVYRKRMHPYDPQVTPPSALKAVSHRAGA